MVTQHHGLTSGGPSAIHILAQKDDVAHRFLFSVFAWQQLLS